VTITAADYPAPDWTIKAHLRGPAVINLTATGDGDTHVLSEASGVTSGFAPGRYVATVRASDGTDTFEIEAGELEIEADVASIDSAHDPRKHAEKVLAAIEAVLEKRATKDQESYTINGRSLTRTSIADLLELHKTYKAEVAKMKGNSQHKRLVRRKVRVSF
jgi:predicted lipoprotein